MIPGSGRRHPLVLVIDDDRDTRELYRACFDTSGYRTREAETGSQAIASAIETTPDVLLTDHVLPDVDGVAIARRLKQDARTAAVRIVMVTAYGTPALERRAADAGIERVLLKPCLPQTVMREVSRMLSRTPPSRPAPGPTEEHERPAALRIRDEFEAMPGLSLTAAQARLVFNLDDPTVERILSGYVADGFLVRTSKGSFRRPL